MEVGSGTGHYIGAFLDASARSLGLATDISPAACRRAARRSPRLGAVVADVWSGLPVATAVLDAVLCVFAPRNPAEFARLVFPGGRLVVVTPRSDHLRELREAFGLLSIGREKLDRLDSSMTSFDLMDREELTLPLELSAELLPASWRWDRTLFTNTRRRQRQGRQQPSPSAHSSVHESSSTMRART